MAVNHLVGGSIPSRGATFPAVNRRSIPVVGSRRTTGFAQARREAPPIRKTRLQWRRADITIDQPGVQTTEKSVSATVVLVEDDIEPDALTDLQDRMILTRRSIQRILSLSRYLSYFMCNPQQYIELSGRAFNRCKQQVLFGLKLPFGDYHLNHHVLA